MLMPKPKEGFGRRCSSLGLHGAQGGRSGGELAGETYLNLCCVTAVAIVVSGDFVVSMAPSPTRRRSSGKEASALPSASSTFWAMMILVGLLIAYCSQLAAGTCEIVTLDRDSSQPRRTIARQTARCACKKGQIAGTTRARPACVDARIIKTKQWCEMLPCLEGEGCDLLINKSGWTCTQPGGRIKTTTKKNQHNSL
ncbi:chemokine-like protein TAFA-5 isoform X2 [Sceloporus undulatus]|uniref:chemokine-like protein TAFA-5 isoform X2 n=1 Tax=Sceloporus undulatus TaxID=8520 RepID=UPI001C4B973A|nr:chemokine-like protein TAFA-5 isoform X2 [Sceloporus undulatus]